MSNVQNNVSGVPSATLANIDALLDDLDLDAASDETIEAVEMTSQLADIVEEANEEPEILEGEITEPETVEASEQEAIEASSDVLDELELTASPADEDISDDLLDAVEAQETRDEAYAAQTGGEVGDVGEAPAAEAKKTSKIRSGEKNASTPRTNKDMGALPLEMFLLTNGQPAGDLEATKAAFMSAMPATKKVIEKIENVMCAIGAEKLPSIYVQKAFAALDAKETVTSSDLVGVFKADYSEGTSRSQAGQMMALFSFLKIADRDGKNLKIRKDSTLADRLRSIIANTQAAPAGA
ncbi:hypothetical protein [Aureimonas sp. AU40]|uniref:hypothetical protein n=1 Tax=Aureimonas sp. AU40 TaxID=1637747 RepID=UPI000785E740|nr:hypothetical protein [Aureimonas sp. AU40]